jgi:plasmid stability protein
MKTISLKLPEEIDRKLAARAEREGTSKSALVRDAVESYLSRQEAGAEGSFLALAGDLIGCVEGPGDLSWNKEYLEELGR